MKHILLITPFEPDTGGGGVIFRSLLPHLEGCRLTWGYIGGEGLDPGISVVETVCLGTRPAASAVRRTAEEALLWLGFSMRTIEPYVRRAVELKPDLVWGNGHLEGVLLAEEISRRLDVPLHMTMHDDLGGAQFARSRRLRSLRRRADKVLERVLRRADSVDVVGTGMQSYYNDRWGIESVVVHRFLPALPMVDSYVGQVGVLRAGHIGSVYSLPEFLQFVSALVGFAESQAMNARLLAIGLRQSFADAIEKTFPGVLEGPPGHVSDEEVPRLLAQCAFVYSSYPLDPSLRVFSQTSSPTKLSTYFEAQRPILVQAPAGSSSEQIVNESGLGTVCTTENRQNLMVSMERIVGMDIPRSSFEEARERYHGFDNVERLAQCLGCLARKP